MLAADPSVLHSLLYSVDSVARWSLGADGQSPLGAACRNVKVPPPPKPNGNRGKTQNAADTPEMSAAYLVLATLRQTQ